MSTEDLPPVAQASEEALAADGPSRDELSQQLDRLQAQATQQYALKNYEAATEFYSEAAQVQEQLHGEMALENADLLYQYGRCLYHVAVSNSDVLGGKVASSEEPQRKKRKLAAVAESSAAAAENGEGSSSLIGDSMKVGSSARAENGHTKESNTLESKPFFQITGDENFTDSEEEDGEDEAAEEEEDDFATAYEILDMARILWSRKLDAAKAASGDTTQAQQDLRHIRERLADIHDLQGEISLENERFADAVEDQQKALDLRLQLYPQESCLIAEAHFKLSLALEFASVKSTAPEEESIDPSSTTRVAEIDKEMRGRAATEMEKAIKSCQARLAKEQESLPSLSADQQTELNKSIADVKDMLADMQKRLKELESSQAPPSINPWAGAETEGILRPQSGESKAQQQQRIADATKTANDLSGLVKHKTKVKVEDGVAEGSTTGKGKRPMEHEGDPGTVEKKVKFDSNA